MQVRQAALDYVQAQKDHMTLLLDRAIALQVLFKPSLHHKRVDISDVSRFQCLLYL